MQFRKVIGTHSISIAEDTSLVVRYYVNEDYIVHTTTHIIYAANCTTVTLDLYAFNFNTVKANKLENDITAKHRELQEQANRKKASSEDVVSKNVLNFIAAHGPICSIKTMRNSFEPKITKKEMMRILLDLSREGKIVYDNNMITVAKK